MHRYDIVNEAVVGSPPERVWDALIAEFQGARQWWVPANTFRTTAGSPDRRGGTVEVTVHPKGVDKGGPKLKFIARTRIAEPGRLLVADYVGGGFSGVSTYTLNPLGDGRTRLAMHFLADPQGPVRTLAKLADVGQEHLKATQAAFVRLDALLRGAPAGAPPVELQVRTDDGALLAVTSHTPATTAPGTPTVVLSHGWGAGRPVWDAVVRRLVGQGFPVVTYDQRGHGASSTGSAPFTVERAGRDLAAVVEVVRGAGLIVVGHSGGGFGALSYAVADAADVEGRLRGLVLLGTAAHDQYVGDGEARMMGNPVFSWALRRGPIGRGMLRHTMGAVVTPADLETNRRLFAATPRKVREAAFRASKGMDLRAGLASVTVPAVVFSGGGDKVVKPALGEAIAAAMPRARYELLPHVGHMLPLEVPTVVARAVAELHTPAYEMR
ncbi:alpha/beta fold hydrolase [Dactylosporangium sp. NPDC048998]|uniref:alpha/beta fold hydrolase n=1 Tax=Dactylosporangium sp. NPDC048998 TaxID=3363976 RepID=UPI003711A448